MTNNNRKMNKNESICNGMEEISPSLEVEVVATDGEAITVA